MTKSKDLKSIWTHLLGVMTLALCMIVISTAYSNADNRPVRKTDVSTPASGNQLVLVDGEFMYLSKTDILKRINEIRLEACNEGVPYPGNRTRKLTPSDYKPIKWSSDLEWIAQTRAAEATIHWDHSRPNGGEWSGLHHGDQKSWSENIAWNGTGNILYGINQWYGEKADWVNNTGAVTGHYTSIINPAYNYIGIGSFKPDGEYAAIACELSYLTGLTESQVGAKGKYSQVVEVKKSKLKVSVVKPSSIHAGKTATVKLNAKTVYENNLGSYWSPAEVAVRPMNVKWSSANSSIAKINAGGVVKGVKGGNTTIKATADGGVYTADIKVTDHKVEIVKKVDASCFKDGHKAGKRCSVCGLVLEGLQRIPAKGEHTWGKYTITKATTVKAGKKQRECKVCHKKETISIPKVSAPTGNITILNTIANSAKRINDVIWDKSKVKGATNYEINWRAPGAAKWASRTVGNTIRGTTSGLTIGGLYEIRVRAVKAATATTEAAYGPWSNTVYRYFFTTQKIRLASNSKGSFTMSWAHDSKATGYQVMFTTNSNGSGAANNIKSVGKTATSYTQTGLRSGVTYYVQVREIKKVGNISYIGNISCPVAVKVK